MLQPEYLEIKAMYSKSLGEKKRLFVSIYTSDKGRKQYTKVTTTGHDTGDFIIEADQIEAVSEFVTEATNAFNQLVKVNEGFTAPNNVTKETK